MGTSELTRLQGAVARWPLVFLALCAFTVAVGLVVLGAGESLAVPVRGWLALRLSAARTPAPSAGRALALAAHNLPVAAWPLLLDAAGAGHSTRSRRIARCLVCGALGANAFPVGAAFSAYGIRVARFAPQIPLEWAALALGASVGLSLGPLRSKDRIAVLATLAALLAGAASVETFGVPHRPLRTPGVGNTLSGSTYLHTSVPGSSPCDGRC
ncbi:MAG: hypothetical protein JWM60_1679 [Solirubrobacterales bacterium]|nr:hypothetical protein [Solirubrobacterales bacterium]